MTGLRNGRQRGFTTVELIVVTAMLFTIAGSAIPAVISSINDLQLHSATQTIVSMLRDTRMQAVNNDVSYALRSDTVAGRARVYIDTNRNGLPDTTEVAAILPPGFTLTSGSGQSGVPQGLGFLPQTGDAAFNPRGVPCVVVGRACQTAVGGQVAGFFYTIRDQRPIGEAELNGISVSPNGRIQTWALSAGNWQETR